VSSASRLRELAGEVRELEERLREGGGPDKVARQHKQGKLTARERVARLCDEGSRFLELGLLVAYDQYEGQAPAAGVVTALRVGLGERIAANAPLLDFTPTHALLALLGVQPDDGPRLRPGMAVQLRAVYGTQTFAGTLRMVGQSINPQSHLLDAQVELPAAAGAKLLAGTPLQAQIRTADFTAWSVPRAAVLHDAHGDYLFQVEHGHAKRVDVTLRSAQGDPVGVAGPLDPQAKVIVLGVYELDDGAAVRESAR
jgi:RND family efflux transporter MFP subunit